MPESATAPSTSEIGSARGTMFLGGSQEPDLLLEMPTTAPGRRLAVFPAFALSIFLSTASVFTDPRIIYPHDSSVTLARQRPARRPISLAEARLRALNTLWLAEHRRAKFAELEAVQVSAIYEFGNL